MTSNLRSKTGAINDALTEAIGSKVAEGKTARDVHFFEDADGSLKTCVLPDAFEPNVRSVLDQFGLKPELWHDQTNRKVRRIGLRIPAEQLVEGYSADKPAILVHPKMSTRDMLEHVTGVKWEKDAESHAYYSREMDVDALRALKGQFFPDVKSGGEAVILHHVDEITGILEIAPSYAIQWRTGQFDNPNIKIPALDTLRAQMAATAKLASQGRG